MSQPKSPKRKKKLTDPEAARKIGQILKKVRKDLDGVQELIKLQKKRSSKFEEVYNELIIEAHKLDGEIPQVYDDVLTDEDDPGDAP